MEEKEETLVDAIVDAFMGDQEQPEPKTEQLETGEKAENEAEETQTEEQPEDSEPPSEEKQETSMVPVAALADERRKRQAYEERLKALEQKLSQYEQPDLDTPDPVSDPEGYRAHVENKVRVDISKERINTSREQMLEKAVDYLEMEQTFLVLANINPQLKHQLLNHPDPARFAYETAMAYRENERAKLKAEILAEQQPQGQPKVKAPKVPDLTKATAKGGNTELKDSYTYEDLLEELPY